MYHAKLTLKYHYTPQLGATRVVLLLVLESNIEVLECSNTWPIEVLACANTTPRPVLELCANTQSTVRTRTLTLSLARVCSCSAAANTYPIVWHVPRSAPLTAAYKP